MRVEQARPDLRVEPVERGAELLPHDAPLSRRRLDVLVPPERDDGLDEVEPGVGRGRVDRRLAVPRRAPARTEDLADEAARRRVGRLGQERVQGAAERIEASLRRPEVALRGRGAEVVDRFGQREQARARRGVGLSEVGLERVTERPLLVGRDAQVERGLKEVHERVHVGTAKRRRPLHEDLVRGAESEARVESPGLRRTGT